MDAGDTMRYLVGGVIHFSVGLAYSVIFALVFAPVTEWDRVTKGVVFGFVITVVALTMMPVAATMLSRSAGSAAANPCAVASAAANPCGGVMANPCAKNPCGGSMVNACNPCAQNPCAAAGMGNPCNPCAKNPCGGGMGNACNPCAKNPCGAGMANACNPCAKNPCGSKRNLIEMKHPAGNPCAPRVAANPCNPCAAGNPCGGGGGGNSYAGLISLVNHIALAMVISFMVRVRRDGGAPT
ncbi:MAG: hypothetical protein ACE5ET_02625 [Gammaproteobacteria bacterium]